MLKLFNLATKVVENIVKSAVSVSETVSVKAAVSSLEEAQKLDTKVLEKQVVHSKEVQKQMDRLFD